MFRSRWVLLFLATSILLAAEARAEEPSSGFEAEIVLTNGSVIVGTVIEMDTETVRVQLKDCEVEPLALPVALIASMVHVRWDPDGTPRVAEPPATEIVRTPVEAGRAMGFGFNVSAGLGYDSTVHVAALGEQLDGPHLDLEPPGFEMRLFPTDDFSIDLLFKIGSLVMRHLQESPSDWFMMEGPFAIMSVYWHFWGRDVWTGAAWITPSIAPGISIGSNGTIGPLPYGMHLGLSMRMGVEVWKEDRAFGWGVHLRPGMATAVLPPGILLDELYQPGAEVMLEFSWCWYLPRS